MKHFSSLILLITFYSLLPPASAQELHRKVRKAFEDQYVWIAGGSDTVGRASIDVNVLDDSTLIYYPNERVVEVDSFLIMTHEVTNAQYRKFVKAVLDSVRQTVGDSLYLPTNERYYSRRMVNTDYLRYSYGGKELNVYPDTMGWVRIHPGLESMTNMYFWHPAYDNYPVVNISQEQAKAYCHWVTRQFRSDYRGELGGVQVRFRLPTEDEWEFAARDIELGYVSEEGGYNANYGPAVDRHGITVKNYIDDGGFNTVPYDQFPQGDLDIKSLLGNVAEWTSSEFSAEALPDPDTLSFKQLPEQKTEVKVTRTKFGATSGVIDGVYYKPEYKLKIAEFNKVQESKKAVLEHDHKVLEGMQHPMIVKGGSWADPAIYLQSGRKEVWEPSASSARIGFRVVVELQ